MKLNFEQEVSLASARYKDLFQSFQQSYKQYAKAIKADEKLSVLKDFQAFKNHVKMPVTQLQRNMINYIHSQSNQPAGELQSPLLRKGVGSISKELGKNKNNNFWKSEQLKQLCEGQWAKDSEASS